MSLLTNFTRESAIINLVPAVIKRRPKRIVVENPRMPAAVFY